MALSAKPSVAAAEPGDPAHCSTPVEFFSTGAAHGSKITVHA